MAQPFWRTDGRLSAAGNSVRTHSTGTLAGAGRPSRAALAAAVVALVAAAFLALLLPQGAGAEAPDTQSSPVTDAEPSELQQRVESTAAAYNEAVEKREAAEQQVAECEQRIAELEEELPAAQDRAADAIYATYRFHQSTDSFLELLLSSDGLTDFISTLAYLNSVSEYNVSQIEELNELTRELEAERATLETTLAEAQAEEEAAETALAEAQAAREEARRVAAEKAAQEQAALAAQAAAAASQTSSATSQDATSGDGQEAAADQGGVSGDETAGGGDAADATVPDENGGETVDPDPVVPDDSGENSGGDTADEVDWNSDRAAFIDEWGARIDAYLSWSTLAGYGRVFAAAAWDYGVDPRWSPAISFVESTCGAYCFLPHNAWGWGSVSWDSWEEAIYAHVAGLARGYGYTLTYEAACTYCPPNADYWYWTVLEQMESI